MMSRALLLGLTLALGLVVCWGCSVARPADLEARLWSCESGVDCIDGWSCADGNVLHADFCRPACDPEDPSTCEDGICTRTGECLVTCVLFGDGSSPCPQGHTCVRTDLLGDEGLCTPAPACSRSSDCAPGTRCLNDALDLPAAIPGVEYASDNLYCVAVPDGSERCPAGYMLVSGAEGEGASCLPRCDSDGARCPPGLVCLRELGYLFAQPGTSPCYPGTWGLPCDDDAQCLLGSCLDVGEGRRACTFSCGEADRVFGRPGAGCEVLEDAGRALRLDALSTACEQLGTSRVCVPRGTAGAPCNDDTLCAAGLGCRSFGIRGGELLRFCSRDCESAQDCEIPGAPITAYCQRTSSGGSCVPRSYEGGTCALPEHCRPGLTCRDGQCVTGLGT